LERWARRRKEGGATPLGSWYFLPFSSSLFPSPHYCPCMGKRTKRWDAATSARRLTTYTAGKGEAAVVHKPCTRSCRAGQGPRTACYHHTSASPSLTVEPWPTNQPHVPTSSASPNRKTNQRPHGLTMAEEKQEARFRQGESTYVPPLLALMKRQFHAPTYRVNV
jgi:hypothetical protein